MMSKFDSWSIVHQCQQGLLRELEGSIESQKVPTNEDLRINHSQS